MNKLIALLAICTTFASCEKDNGPTTVSGQVLWEEDDIPVVNGRVIFGAYSSSFPNSNLGTIGEEPLDEFGKFSASLPAEVLGKEIVGINAIVWIDSAGQVISSYAIGQGIRQYYVPEENLAAPDALKPGVHHELTIRIPREP